MKKLAYVFAVIVCLFEVNGCGGAVATPTGCAGASCPQPSSVTHFSVIGTRSVTAGQASNFTVTALDASGGTLSAYRGLVHFTSSDAKASLPPDSNLINGMLSFSVTFETLGMQSVVVADTANASVTGTTGPINVITPSTLQDATGPFPNGTVGHDYGIVDTVTDHPSGCSVTFTGIRWRATGGVAPYSWSLSPAPGSSLPPGLGPSQKSVTCGGSTRCCTTVTAQYFGGIPTTAGTFHVNVTVVDSASPPAQATASYSIVIADPAAAQSNEAEALSPKQHARYRLIDLGTFGGLGSQFSNGADGILNNHGVAVGWTHAADPDPFAPFCFDVTCLVTRPFQVRGGTVKDLGTLPGGVNGQPTWIAKNDLIAGISENGELDPLGPVPGVPEFRAVLWRNGEIIDLGTLPEGGNESFATAVNNRGQVVGWAVNTVPDPFSFVGFPTQTRAFLWQKGKMEDIGTLGGPDAIAGLINDRGQVTGPSYTADVDPVTGVPVVHPFLWEDGKMIDLGSLGGTDCEPTGMNQRGQVIGQSTLAGDTAGLGGNIGHPFLWSNGKINDLGTLGGNTGAANWINDRGDIAGKADLVGPLPQLHDAVLWSDGKAIDLGVLPGDACSNAYFVNNRGQVVGTSENEHLCSITVGQHAFLWERGGPMVDLNTLIAPGANLTLMHAFAINERGEIAGVGLPPGCAPEDNESCGHAYLLFPCEEETRCVNLTMPVADDQVEIPLYTEALPNSSTKTRNKLFPTTMKAIRDRMQLLRNSAARTGEDAEK